MNELRVNIIGAGRLGKTIGRLLAQRDLGTISGVCNRTLQSAEQAALFMGQGKAVAAIGDLPKADLVFITTPDALIAQSCLELTRSSFRPVVVHCSGVLSSDILKPAKAVGCAVASVHPLRSFADPAMSVHEFAGTYCAIEGDEAAKRVVRDFFDGLRAKCFEVDPSKKALYHASAVFASNYVVMLFDKAVSGLVRSGIDQELATQVALSLMEGTVRNLRETSSAQKSLTGPIKRGDVDTIERHLSALQDGEGTDLYRSLARATLEVAGLPEETRRRLESVMTSFA